LKNTPFDTKLSIVAEVAEFSIGLKIASTWPLFVYAIEMKISGPYAITLLMTRIENTTVKIEQKAKPKWHLLRLISRIEWRRKNLAF
jgi:hypothetical protein